MELGLRDRVYLVTGGSRGLGFATAEALVAEGALVTITGRTASVLDSATGKLDGRATGVVADNADPAAAERLVNSAVDRYGRLDGVLISVGGPPIGSVTGTADDEWRRAFESVFLGAIRMARSAVSSLSADGAVGFVLSSSVRTPIPGMAVSNGLRPGLAMACKALADEIGPRGLRAFGLVPGRIATDRLKEVDARDPQASKRNEEAIPMRRFGAPHEFGRIAAFLLSPAASYITGCVIPVDGGLLRAL
jgi:3-oxoacyl-[acyl-carrier protein] reductase